jgi:hypothetical protein
MEIKIQVKSVYGNETIYPVCDKAKLFAAIAGQKTLTHKTIKDIKALGFNITLVAAPRPAF